eukprot:2015078-Amphidinium_carterae.1
MVYPCKRARSKPTEASSPTISCLSIPVGVTPKLKHFAKLSGPQFMRRPQLQTAPTSVAVASAADFLSVGAACGSTTPRFRHQTKSCAPLCRQRSREQ